MLYRERRLLVLLALACLWLLGGALWLQYHGHEDPCPLCILQRYCFLFIALAALVGSRFRVWSVLRVVEGVALVFAIAGMTLAARHVYVQAHASFSCGFDEMEPFVDALPPAHWWPGFFRVSGLCETPYPPILGLSLPMWSLWGFLVASVGLSTSLWCNRKLS